MHTRADHHHRPLFRLALGACCLLLATGSSAFGQLLEFKSGEVRGRIDRPSTENVWILGDDNGNGTLDENESFGPQVDLDAVFLLEAGRGYVEIAPVNVFGSTDANLMFGHLDRIDAVPGPFAADGLADDIDSDGQFGPDGFDTEDPSREPDVIYSYGTPVDFDDLVHLPVAYELVGVNSHIDFGGAHLMHVLKFEGNPEFTLTSTPETLEIGYGARFYGGGHDLRVFTAGSTLGTSEINTSIDTLALGPQVSLKWAARHGSWRVAAEAAAALHYIDIDGDQRGEFNVDAVPGTFNRGLFSAPITIENHVNEWDIAPALEAGLVGSYDISPTTLCFVSGDAFQMPRLGHLDPGGNDVTVTAASIGVEVRR